MTHQNGTIKFESRSEVRALLVALNKALEVLPDDEYGRNDIKQAQDILELMEMSW